MRGVELAPGARCLTLVARTARRSDANGGGFASVRFDDMNKEVWDRFQAAFKAGCDSIAVSAKPTDRDFKVVLRSQDVPYGVYYTARMHTTAEGVLPSEEGFVTYIVPLAAFEPRVQGKRWQGGPALGSFEHVRSVGFMVGDGQLGAYSLQARSVFAMNMAAAGWAPVTGDRAAAEGVQSTLLEEGRVVLTSVPTDAAPPRKPKELVREVPEGEEVPPPLSEDVLQGRVPRGATEDRAQSEL